MSPYTRFSHNEVVAVRVALLVVVLGACGFREGRAAISSSDAAPDASPDGEVIPQDLAPARVSSGLIALYTFAEGTGTIAHDTSGVSPALDLTLPGTGVSWTSGAISFDSAAIQRRDTETQSSQSRRFFPGRCGTKKLRLRVSASPRLCV